MLRVWKKIYCVGKKYMEIHASFDNNLLTEIKDEISVDNKCEKYYISDSVV